MRKNKLTAKARKHIRLAKFFIISLIFVGIAASFGLVGFNYINNQNFKETFYCVGSLKVNNKIRVIQISDLHNASFGDDNKVLIDRVEKLKPDLIILTGDCIDSNSQSEKNAVSLCSKLVEIAPLYYIYGNNEVEKYYDTLLSQNSLDKKFGFTDENRDPQKLLEITDSFTEKLQEAGVKVLKNSFDTITVGTTNIDVYGVLTSNPSAFWSYAGASFDEYIYSNSNNLKITAIHEPNIFKEFSPNTWGDVTLAGHTHGGIAKLPVLGPIYTHDGGLLPEREGHFVYGRYEVQGRPLIVTSGLDNSSFFRINNQPEIVIVDINKF